MSNNSSDNTGTRVSAVAAAALAGGGVAYAADHLGEHEQQPEAQPSPVPHPAPQPAEVHVDANINPTPAHRPDTVNVVNNITNEVPVDESVNQFCDIDYSEIEQDEIMSVNETYVNETNINETNINETNVSHTNVSQVNVNETEVNATYVNNEGYTVQEPVASTPAASPDDEYPPVYGEPLCSPEQYQNYLDYGNGMDISRFLMLESIASGEMECPPDVTLTAEEELYVAGDRMALISSDIYIDSIVDPVAVDPATDFIEPEDIPLDDDTDIISEDIYEA